MSEQATPGLTEFDRAHRQISAIADAIGQVVIGQDRVVAELLHCFVASGHALIEGVPGLGKTLLVRALAKCFAGKDTRIQFTPDLMPSDVTGHALYNMKAERFGLRRKPRPHYSR